MTSHRYWAMRTDQARRAFTWRELRAGRMRQGWGIRPDDNLEHLQRIRRAGGRLDDFGREVWLGNRRLLPTEPGSMQVGDIVVLPHLPRYGAWSVVRVIGGYRYAVSDEPNTWNGAPDYGHIRDVELLTDERGIDRVREGVPEELRKAMRNRQRLWSLDPVAEQVEPFLVGRPR